MTEGMTIQVFTGDERPVVVKTATTPEARDALQRESERLSRARHPGVVEVVSAVPDRLEVGWVGVHTLETAKLPVPAAAAVLAAVAETVADLHSMGIVHGRLDPSHVILTGDGRPVLCGMVGPDPSDVVTGPADDVGAVGRLMDHLLGPEAEPEPIPERRWSRKTWSGYQRRALQSLADRAAHDDPARRPTARALANAIVEAIPEARLQPAPRADLPDRPRSTEVGPQPRRGTSDRTPPLDPGEATVMIETTDIAASGVDREQGPTPDDRNTTSMVSTRGDAGPGGRGRSLHGHDPDHEVDVEVEDQAVDVDELLRRASEPVSPKAVPGTFLGLRVEDTTDGHFDPLSELPYHAQDPVPVAASGRRGETPRYLAIAAALVVAFLAARTVAGSGDEQTVALEQTPAPAASVSESLQTSADESVPSAEDTTSSSEREDVGPETPSPPHSEATRVLQAGITYSIGEPGDAVEVADWDCNGTETPGVVRPSTGEVFLFDRWATAGQPLVSEPSLVVPGAKGLVPPSEGTGCVPRLLLDDGAAVAILPAEAGGTQNWTIEEGGAP